MNPSAPPYYIIHNFELHLGECPEQDDFDVTDASCDDNDGAVCIDNEDFDGYTFAFGSNPSVDGCVYDQESGSYFIIMGATESGVNIQYQNLLVEIGQNVLDVGIVPPGSFCGGTFEASITGGTGPYIYEWNVPDWMTADSYTNDEINLSGGYGLITLTVTDDNGCVDTENFWYVGELCAANLVSSDPEVVNVNDLLEFMGNWGTDWEDWTDTMDPTGSGCADFNGDGFVNIPDLLLFLAAYPSECE